MLSRGGTWIALFWLLRACTARAAVASMVVEGGPDQVIAAAVEATHSGGKGIIEGDPLAAVVGLPQLYEGRGFRPAWTGPAGGGAARRALRGRAEARRAPP